MNRSRINKIEIKGFRAFGKGPQTLELTAPIAVVWAPNSHGKTSLAEAFEFLLTGEIVRRDLVAGARNEFADALKNAHIQSGEEVYVEADIIDLSGVSHTVKRTLISDYGKQDDCQSTIKIDGNVETEQKLISFGINLSQPPFRAPVLAQHTLGYLFSAGPKDRSTYFKTLLEITDIDDFRKMVDLVEKKWIPTEDDILYKKLVFVAESLEANGDLDPLIEALPSFPDMTNSFEQAIAAVIVAAGGTTSGSLDQLVTILSEMLVDRREQMFPVGEFEKQNLTDWTLPPQDKWDALNTYQVERNKISGEIRRLTMLFRDALEIPDISNAKDSLDCPLCGKEGSLTLSRIDKIRNWIQETEEYKKAQDNASESFRHLNRAAHKLENIVNSSCPRFLVKTPEQRRSDRFRIYKIKELLRDVDPTHFQAWFTALRTLAQTRKTALELTGNVITATDIDNFNESYDATHIKKMFDDLEEIFTSFKSNLQSYLEFEQALVGHLNSVIDSASDTQGWREIIDLAGDLKNLHDVLINRQVHRDIGKDLKKTIRRLDRGNEKVLEDKFKDLSGAIQHWWEMLRPDDLSFFSSVGPRPGTRHSVDFKVSLATEESRSALKIRDAVAVFSQSQLHCLGLAIFIARALREKAGFIVLDDPVLSSDEDYRGYFNSEVLKNLLNDGVQIILLTQSQSICRDLENLYRHKGISMFQMNLDDPSKGTRVTATFNNLQTMLMRISILTRSSELDRRKDAAELIRDAAERFCKEILVKDSQKIRNHAKVISDYNGKSLGNLIQKAALLLIDDPAHPGTLSAIGAGMNPGNHDDDVPDKSTLRVAFGNLNRLVKIYVPHETD